ncbi:DEHA2E07766p [Debaryomyces hansenii CBS767]|uniref:DEHA2E07766p n=1 Tax=Debaryomyces hansenii (strain ATCC 36239 / CBS 767 / BCRC 21394 / JCM 1990 / NBRC 0083 / IGC 2968) TaxID=284592 RepID=B5RTX1_DEBHA|nr:DEHA2E07766p [Debaryomyces hansenii CBS767]CAR65783.1 DEHA2E07766p [Debaryomyces hansenii CBS767]|eukprot:XP_002770439.1 DEHA2E07766p [Debaryomyces hansenii CBS767]
MAKMEENTEKVNCDVTQGNTYCRVVYDSANIYSSLESSLLSTVFVKLYHYSKQLWKENDLACFTIPDTKCYYDMFFN